MSYPHLASRLFNVPLLIAPAKLDSIIGGLGARLLGGHLDLSALPDFAPGLFTSAKGEYADSGYRVVDGVGVVDVFGILAHRGGMQPDSSRITGYQDVARMIAKAQADASVSGILLNLDTPGGEAGGAFDLADLIARSDKPIWACAADNALSAGYMLAAPAGRIAISQSGSVGSVGVVMRHVDLSGAMAKEGMQVSHIYAGAKKTLGNPYAPLSESDRAELQGKVDALYGLFVDAVASRRKIDSAAVRGTEAGILDAREAVAAKFADVVATPDQMISELRDYTRPSRRVAGKSQPLKRSSTMSQDREEGAGMEAPALTQADIDRARAEGHAEGVKAGTEAERARAAGIRTHSEAAGREALAGTLIDQGLSVEQAGAILAASPKVAQAIHAAGNPFAAHMAALGNPGVVAGEAAPEAAEAAAITQGWMRAFRVPAANKI